MPEVCTGGASVSKDIGGGHKEATRFLEKSCARRLTVELNISKFQPCLAAGGGSLPRCKIVTWFTAVIGVCDPDSWQLPNNH